MEREKLIATVCAAQNGDSDALNELFNAFYNDVYYFALKTVKDDDLACDITQETFVEIINTIGDLQEPAAFVKWMKQITYHQCTRYFKKKKDVLVDEDEEGNTVFDTLAEDKTEFIPDEALDQQDFRDTILAMLDELSEEQRSATMLYYYDELSVKQIAEIQNVSEGTVKSRLNYARKSIKNSVETYEKKNGVKLHCAGVLPLLLWLLSQTGKETMPAAAAQTVAGGVTAATGVTVAASAGGAAVATATATAAVTTTAATAAAGAGLAAKIAALPVVTKVVAGIVAGSLVLGGVGMAVITEDKPEPTIQNTTAPSSAAPTQTETSLPSTEETLPSETTVPTTETTLPPETTSPTTGPEQTQSTAALYYVAEGYTYTTADGRVLSVGDSMPETPAVGDTYANDIYTYRYGSSMTAEYDNFENLTRLYWLDRGSSGWAVSASDMTQNTYPAPEAEICGYPLISMNYAYYNCAEMTEAPIIPETVTALNGTFYGCTSLTTAPKIPFGVTHLYETFKECTALTEAPVIPAGVVGLTRAFAGCTALVNAPAIPAGTEELSGTFKGCSSLIEAPVLPDGITDLAWAFADCTSLTKAPQIPDSVETLSGTFSGCTNLAEVPNLPSSLTNMYCTFAECTALTSAPTIPSGVTNMWGAFMACTALESTPELPETVTNLGSTFMSCLKITQAPVIPASVTEMQMTFYGCSALTGTVEIHADPANYADCFAYTQQPITLIGSSTMLAELAATGTNGNVTVQIS